MDDDKIHDDDTVIEYGDRSVRRRVRLSLALDVDQSIVVWDRVLKGRCYWIE